VQSPHFKVVDAQCAHTPAFHGERANGEPSDGNRTDRSGPEGERAECHRTKTESARGACRLSLVCPGLASRRLNLSISSLPNLRVGHGAPRSTAVGFADLPERSEWLILRQGQQEWFCSELAWDDASMRSRDATEMLADSGVDALGPTIWADLGCGNGTFTLALAEVLASGSVIHAVDLDGSGLRRIPSAHKRVRITTHRADFMRQPWSFADLDGILMANSLHYVKNQAAFIRECESHMKPRRRFLIVEYDTSEPSRWVPYPVGQTRLTSLFERAGYLSVRVLRSRPSIYRRAPLYAAVIAL
jgi:SAM-dependent methyltransferase